jgi:hypothetical protein
MHRFEPLADRAVAFYFELGFLECFRTVPKAPAPGGPPLPLGVWPPTVYRRFQLAKRLLRSDYAPLGERAEPGREDSCPEQPFRSPIGVADPKLQYTGQSVLSEGSSVSDSKSNGLAGILPFVGEFAGRTGSSTSRRPYGQVDTMSAQMHFG